MTDIGGEWYMGKSAKGLPPMGRTKLQERQDEKNKNMKLISGGMIEDSNCIGTNLNGWIQNLPPENINPILFLHKRFT